MDEFVPVRITREYLNRLRMLMDWQVRHMGFDPDSITVACLVEDEEELAGVVGPPCSSCGYCLENCQC
jgi:hypothetical protein